MTESELDDMLGEVGGSCNFDNMLKMFQTKMAGGDLHINLNNFKWENVELRTENNDRLCSFTVDSCATSNDIIARYGS